MSRLARPLAIAAAVVGWVPPIVYGLGWPGYDPVRQFISELGATGAPDAAAVNVWFLVAGTLFVAAVWALSTAWAISRVTIALVSAIGVSYVVAAFVPCDAGCPAEGSTMQAIHNTSGAFGYFLGGIGLIRSAQTFAAAGAPGLAWFARCAGAIVLAGLMAIGAPELASSRGLAQRLLEAAAFVWLVATAWRAPSRSPALALTPTSAS
jgi:hypothetical membrane protein